MSSTLCSWACPCDNHLGSDPAVDLFLRSFQCAVTGSAGPFLSSDRGHAAIPAGMVLSPPNFSLQCPGKAPACMVACKLSMHECTTAGEQLSSGWTPVLRLLEAVPSAHGAAPTLADTGNTAISKAAVVGLSFQSVQLLASDYMSSLPPHLLRTCLSVATLYARQQVRCIACRCAQLMT